MLHRTVVLMSPGHAEKCSNPASFLAIELQFYLTFSDEFSERVCRVCGKAA